MYFFMLLFSQQMLTEYLLCAEHSKQDSKQGSKQGRHPCWQGAPSLLEEAGHQHVDR